MVKLGYSINDEAPGLIVQAIQRERVKRNCLDANILLEHYRVLRNKCTQEIRRAKIKFTHNLLNTVKQPQLLWSKLKFLGVGPKSKKEILPNLNLNDLNDFFSEHKEIDSEVKQNTISQILQATNDIPLFNFSEIFPKHIETAVNKIKSSASGPDDISIVLIKKILPYILVPLAHIFNCSLETGIFPEQWKAAFVRPIAKTSAPETASDFRPINILPALSKVFEHVIYDQMRQFLHEHNLLDPLQSGFRPLHSTTTALANITDDIRQAMDHQKVTILVLLDYSKAFQKIDHNILIAKLTSHFNFSRQATNLIHSYLSNRRQAVSISAEKSKWNYLNCGVPQGSVLGPLFYLLYTHDLPGVIKHSNYHLFADDLQCYISVEPSKFQQAVALLNSDLRKINKWSRANGLEINPNKSNLIFIGSQKILPKIDYINTEKISIDDVAIPVTQTVTNLGIVINKHLLWKDHADYVCKKAYSALHSLYRLKKLLPSQIKKLLIQSLVLSQIDYADIVYIDISENMNQRLQRIQNSCARLIYNLKYSEHVTPYIEKLGWLKVKERRRFHSLLTIFKALHYHKPSYLHERLKYQSDAHSLNTRSRQTSLLTIPAHNTKFFSNSFTVKSIRHWNDLPEEIRNSSSVAMFRNATKAFLIKDTYQCNS